MLVLTRKSNESIMIGNDVEIKILKIQSNQVHLGITAPRFISVYRHEIYSQVISENKKAMQSNVEINNLGKLEQSLNGFQNLIDAKKNNGDPVADK